ncbi:hypothetical protein FEM48_Zijuj06G0038700 [Ziziphus jujuba var. spinosa]|uniref:Cytochrome P450 81E8-like n=1 Tax=Ziziphus jujuba var. spinosa TaxID=714518 RepID=A0A978V706_ZIZJJ|nr:hypothetical protein FEM48_Zijuj06G0038700 [Ziziphus jujuba var. spinosa]
MNFISMEHLYHYLALFLSIFLITKFLFHRNKNSPPGPFALPLIGHLHLLKQPLCQTLESLSLKHGPILSLKFGCRSVLVLSSPSAVDECFAQNDVTFANRPRTLAGDYLTYNYANFVWAPYGHVWRSLRRLSTTEILSQKSLQKFSAIREEQVCSFVRQLLKIIGNGTQKVELQYLFSTLLFNIMMSVAAGKQCIEEEIATTILGKQYLQEMKDKFFASLTICMCDFFPILRWVDYKQSKKSMIMLHRQRDEFLQGLIEEIRQKKSTPLNPTTALESEKRTTLIESLLSLQESDPEYYSDIVVKAILLVKFGTALRRNKPLEAVCSARHVMVDVLAQL